MWGAGAGSYEPVDRDVIAVEPSATMRSQRPGWLPPAIVATAEDLPFPDNYFDAAMATFTVHQWQDLETGLRQMRRVCRDGFSEAYYGRPEMFLDPRARRANSAWSFLGMDEEARAVQALSDDLKSGAWDSRYGALRTQPFFEGSLVVIVSQPED